MSTIRILCCAAFFSAPARCALAHQGVIEPAHSWMGDDQYPAARQGGAYMHNYYIPPATGSNPWAPAWSPDGRFIAVGMSGSIWNVDPGTGVARELTYDKNYHASPDWSPDGKWIVYTADDGGVGIQLQIVNVATGESFPLTGDHHIYADPAFSPDGKHVAYVSTKPNGYFNVYVRPIADGRFNGPEMALTVDNKYARDRPYFGAWDMHITPRWGKGGKDLLLVSNRNVPLGSGNVVRVPVAPGAMKSATTVLAEQSLYRARPDVSIDGRRFVYSSTAGAADQYSNLYVLPVEGGAPYKLTFFEHDAFHPRWSPDGKWIAYISNKGGLPHLASLETYGGQQKDIAITQRIWKRPMGVLKVRVIEAGKSKRPTPVRIHLTASDGKVYAPPDVFVRMMQGSRANIFHSRGEFQVDVPPGTMNLDAVKGFAFWPEHRQIEVKAGGTTTVVIPLRRLADMTARGWYSGSTHVHMNYGGNLHSTLEYLMDISAAEDQDVVSELVANKDNRVLDHQYFVPGGGAHPISKPGRLVIVGQEYRPPFWGHVSFLGLKDHLLSPWATGYEGTGIESPYPSNTDMLGKAKQQAATTDYAHAFRGDEDPLQSADLGQGKGFIVDAALGTTDALEWSFASRANFYPWYAILNSGLRVAAIGGDDSVSDLHILRLTGSVRTYVHTGARGLDAHAWMEGIRKGATVMSTGPLLDVKVGGKLPGGEIHLPPGGGPVEISVWLRSITPLVRAFLVWNGGEIEDIPLNAGRNGADYKKIHNVAHSGWFHVRAEGRPRERFPLDAGAAMAFSGPTWVIVGKAPVRNLGAAGYCLKWIDKLQELAAKEPGWRSQKERDLVFAQLEQARAVYRRLASEAR